MKGLKILAMLGLVIWVIGCIETLEVENPNDPDTQRTIASPSDVEALIAGSFRTYWFATEHWTCPLGLTTIADENSSSWGNEGMKDLSSEPRVAFNNTTAYASKGHIEVPWYDLYGAISAVNDGLRAILDPDDPMEIGTDGEHTPRAIAFARFIQGLSYGFLAEMFDQAYIVDETDDLNAIALGEVDVPLSPYGEVMDAAIGYLGDCIAECSGEDFTTPDTWINGVALTSDGLARLAHSYTARFMAAVARTPTERAAVNWDGVKTHVAAGIQEGEDFGPVGDGWINWYSWYREITWGPYGWMRADYKTIGLADTSSGYQNWLDTQVAKRDEFLLYTADRRVTGCTACPDSEGTYFSYNGASPFQVARGTYHFSMYAYEGYRDLAYYGNVPMWTMTHVEMRLLEAEAEYRLGHKAAAADIVNETRVTNGELPALTGDEDDFFEWLKYEKGIETFARQVGLFYFDRRGWGDLVTGTPLHFPVPAKELEVGQLPLYTHGGTTGDYAPKRIPTTRVSDVR
ncbi:MAG: hypothetical protein ACETWG_08550, partial [Candidatus Neomarinimicrobiota bacterium]